ncbi:MAG: DUF1566 domain-containing protein [Candidatus Moranbacteria bacterium]|nr:DUF1566 domain-containing protein [Candidatus Moranbacteria bacterium]
MLVSITACNNTPSADPLEKNNTTKETKPKLQTAADSKTKIKLPDTGQAQCFDSLKQIDCPSEGEAFFGQDAQYLSNKPSFVDNGDGTVTDQNTGLMWTKAAGEKLDYLDIEASSFAGYDDWRVPSIKELYTLIDFSGIDVNAKLRSDQGLTPFIDTEYFDFEYGDTSSGDRIIDSQWATSSLYVSKVMNREECFFGVNFADGRIKCYPTRKGKGYFARFVRGDYTDNDFYDNKNQTITDKSTGLIWQKQDSGRGMNWQEALAYCEDLKLGGHSNWRLPNAKELQFIIDYSRSPDTTNSAAIDPLFETSEIKNEAGQKDYPFYWTSTTHLNQRNAQEGVYVAFGRALGYMNGKWMDVHGAGAQRSDPKTGSADDFPQGFGPQGDARRIDNYVRCVR